jgi:hypothetical protein
VANARSWPISASHQRLRIDVKSLALDDLSNHNRSYCSPGPPSATIDRWTHPPARGRFTVTSTASDGRRLHQMIFA